MFALMVQTGYGIVPTLAQYEQDAQEIKKVIEKFTESFVYRDLDSVMSQVSMNYSCATCKEGKDYNTIKLKFQKLMHRVFRTYADYSISELRLNNLNIQDNNATVEVAYSWEGFNLDTLKEDGGREKKDVSLTKENGSWKITKWHAFHLPK